MQIFQKSVIKKYFNKGLQPLVDKENVNRAFETFNKVYSPEKIEQIKNLKEEEYQDGFLRDLFVRVFGFTLKPDDDYNLVRELKNLTDSKKADGAIVKNTTRGHVPLAVIELKSTKTKDLTSITQQAFNYKNNQPGCKYVITSNFQKLRFYIDYANEYEEFDLFALQKADFDLLYLILNKENIFADLPQTLKDETRFHEKKVSENLYNDYSDFKYKIFHNLVKNNPQYDKLTLFEKSQKLLDRLLFIFFAEDSGLLPANSIARIIEHHQQLIDLDAYKPLYEIYKQYFGYMNKGRKGKKSVDDIPAYNGGLFAPDELLDSVTIDDEILKDDSLKLSAYDFSTEVDVNILGHIFEHSLNEIEEIEKQLSETDDIKVIKTSRRKKDGVFYTPKYITQYIVENTLGKLCEQKRKEEGIFDVEFDESQKAKKGLSKKGKELFEKLTAYKDWLLTLKIVDPACGSGAFLNQALNFLITEHRKMDEIIAELTGDAIGLFDTDKAILENNLFGVDINQESVEIAKLSLWLRTAQKGRKLSHLNNNIKVGNSLVDETMLNYRKTFNWKNEFPQVFREKEKSIWHITTATHNSRYSQRMFDNNVKRGKAIWLDEEDEILITETIGKIIKEDKLNVPAYNICGDHMHLILVCEEKDRDGIVGKLKAISSRKYNIAKGITIPDASSETATRGHVPLSESGNNDNDRTRGHVPLSESGNNNNDRTRGYVPLSESGNNDNDRTRGYVPLSESGNNNNDTKKEKKKYNSLWTQKYGKKKLTDNEQYNNTLNYIRNNRKKHELPENPKLQKIIAGFVCSAEHAFRTEYNGGFDVVIGNPPYIKEYTNREAFTGLHEHYCYQGKMDLWYFFGALALEIVKKDIGLIGYIAPNNWITNSGASKFRNIVLDKGKLIEFIDFGNFMVFDTAGIQTMIYIMKCSTENENYEFEYSKIIESKINHETNQQFLEKVDDERFQYFTTKIDKQEFLNKTIHFINASVGKVIDKIAEKQNFTLDKKEVAQGIVPNPDVVNKRNFEKINKEKVKKYDIKVGNGVFVVDKDMFKTSKFVKPLYEPENFSKYYHIKENIKSLIYIPKRQQPEPDILEHLSKYKEIMEDRRENLKGSIEFFNLHWGRDENFFKEGKKIVSLRKCVNYPVFSYTESACYVMLSFNVIKTDRLNLKYITGLLNSKLIAFWLKYKGKMQGDNYQVDKEPLLNLPLIQPNAEKQTEIAELVSQIIENKQKELDYGELRAQAKKADNFDREIKLTKELETIKTEIQTAENRIDTEVYHLYALSEKDVAMIEKEIK